MREDEIENADCHYFLRFKNCHQPFPKKQILNSSKLKDIAVDNFKFD